MKTLFEKLLIQFTFMAHPAGGSLLRTQGAKPARTRSKHASEGTMSPDGFNLRGRAKKSGDVRRTPAP